MTGSGAREALPRSIPVLTLGLGIAAVLVTAWRIDAPAISPGPAWALLPLTGLLAAAEYLVVRFRYRGEIDALNLFEAALAPLLFCFPVPAVVGAVAISQIVVAVIRKNDLIRGSFNVAQWSLAAALGAATVHALALPDSPTAAVLIALLFGLLVAGLVNQTAFATALRLSQRQPVQRVLATIGPFRIPGWLAGWSVNVCVGVLFVAAFDRWPGAVLIFAVPLMLLHVAERGYSQALRDRLRLARLHGALRLLAEPVDPRLGLAGFLEELRVGYRASAAELILVGPHEVERQRQTQDGHGLRQWRQPVDEHGFISRLVAFDGAKRITARNKDATLRAGIVAEGFDVALVAPLRAAGVSFGAVVIYDLQGLVGFSEGEAAMLDGVARETAAILEKGRAIEARLEERRTVAAIVDGASDGIIALTRTGRITRWNPAMEAITGWSAEELPADVLHRLFPRDSEGRPIRIDRWSSVDPLPGDLQIINRTGQTRWLSCSYGRIRTSEGEGDQLIVMARDVTGVREIEHLRQEVDRLIEKEAEQREVVHRLQQAVRPKVPSIDGTELGVFYLASDPSAPTGGDLYDWQHLSDGSVHLAVVDVMGHGVSATKDALMVSHILRTLALQGTALEVLLAKAAEVLAVHDPNLVATALVGRFDPSNGELRMAGGGHPPAVVVRPDGAVSELFAPGIALGWPGAGSTDVVSTTLEVGDTVVLYTDGLIEGTRDVVEGLAALGRNAARMAREPVAHLARRLVEESLGSAERRDDTLALVLRRAEPASDEVERWERTYAAAATEVARLRRDAISWLVDREVASGVRDDCILVLSELATNASRAGATEMTVRMTVSSTSVRIELQDDGRGMDSMPSVGASTQPDVLGEALPVADLRESGRGLNIVHAVTDQLSIFGAGAGTLVRCQLGLKSSEDSVSPENSAFSVDA